MKSVEDVPGKGREQYAEGQEHQSGSIAFRHQRRHMRVDGRLFEIIRLRGGGSQLAVKFGPQVITFIKEVWKSLWLNFQAPHAVSSTAEDAKRAYPHPVSLMETARTYGQTPGLVESNKGIEWLVAEYRDESQRMICKLLLGLTICWDYLVNHYDTSRYVHGSNGQDNRHIQFVREFASMVSILQGETTNAVDLYKDIFGAVEEK
ncbi:hypothetical protein CVT26_005746 [Gymnopilus dilepis]|uniref:Dynein heavy chain tail domain-containing protein n=1 Tax=Gymnopilus dilepis TaxID=231916 RepID=A0A409XA14_9AGAR|nr:hypothetical protein CVT26_005746 [Gymnopilus dilepis]